MAKTLLFLFIAGGALAPQCMAATEVPVLAYHDVVAGKPMDDFAVTADAFREQMQYLRREGYQPISLNTYAEAAMGRAQLPRKPILLTFDDGLKSFQQIVLPVMETFGYPAVVSVVTGWLDGRDVPDAVQGRIMTWDDLRTVARSRLVEILAHSDALHADVLANAIGVKGPAAVTRRYVESKGKIEGEDIYRARIRRDLEIAASRIRSETGMSPRGITWPYGFYNQPIANDAGALGMNWQLTISDGPSRLGEYPHIRRVPVYRVRILPDFERVIRQTPFPPKIALAVRLEGIVHKNADVRHRWLSDLLERIVLLEADALIVAPPPVNAGISKGVTSPSGSGADFLQQVLNSARTRSGVRYLWLQIPDVEHGTQVHKELAYHNIYDGVLVSGIGTAEDTSRIVAIYRNYRPGLRCGLAGKSENDLCTDFTIQEVSGPEAVDNIFSKKFGEPPVYYRIQEDSTQTGGAILATIKMLRQKGVQHVIVPYGSLANSPQALVPVAVELSRLGSRKD